MEIKRSEFWNLVEKKTVNQFLKKEVVEDIFDLDLQIKESPPGPNDGAGYTTGTKTFCGTCTCMTCYSACTCATCVDCK